MICGHGHEQKFRYPYPRNSKKIPMPYPRAKAIDQNPALCPAGLTLIGAYSLRWQASEGEGKRKDERVKREKIFSFPRSFSLSSLSTACHAGKATLFMTQTVEKPYPYWEYLLRGGLTQVYPLKQDRIQYLLSVLWVKLKSLNQPCAFITRFCYCC